MGGTICRASRPQEQVSKALLWLPWFIVNQVISAAKQAEETLGHPPTMIQIFSVLQEHYNSPLRNVWEVGAIACSLHREELIYCDKIIYRWTAYKQEGYLSYSEMFMKQFGPAYGCNAAGKVYSKTARTVNFGLLTKVLKSKNENIFLENGYIWDGEFKFLDASHNLLNEGSHVAFTSFPRSGNSFLRKFVEQVSGITTGSAMPMHTATAIQIMGMKGEGHIDNSIWVAKSHLPIVVPGSTPFLANKTFVCVRNPLDVFPSYAALANTMSHGNKPDYEIHTEFPEWWAWFVKK